MRQKVRRREQRDEGEIVVQNYNLRLLLIGLMGVVIMLVGALMYKSMSASVMPYVVEVDTTTGSVRNVGTIESSKNYKPNEAVYKYFLSKFVKNIREVPLDPIVYRENLNASYGFLTKSAMAKLQTMLKTEGMSERFGHQTVQVEISTVLPMEGGYSYQIRWQEESFVIGSGERRTAEYLQCRQFKVMTKSSWKKIQSGCTSAIFHGQKMRRQ